MGNFTNEIYLITTLGRVKYDDFMKADDFAYSRTVGFYTDLEDAQRCVKENWGDICEVGCYPYALVERVESGLYGATSERWLYQWNDINKCYEQILEFDFMKHIVGYGMG